MSYLVNEILLRLAKVLAALIIALLTWVAAVALLGATPSVELALLCWLSGGAFILLVESSPI